MSATDYCVVLITASGPDEAERLATALVAERLAACVNIVPGVKSVYSWQGKIEHDEEALLVVKTARASFAALRDRVIALHSYDVPEVIAVDLSDASPGYLQFLADATGPA